MNLSLTNYKTTLPPALLRKAEKCAVRECDETGNGTYEAYVDEGDNSFDVMLKLGKNKEAAEHRCDCGSTEPFCRHKAALLLALAGKMVTKAPAVKGKKAKQSKADLLLEAAEADSLKAWVKELLDKNKDIALAFEQRFGEKKTAYTEADAKALTADAVKSVVKNRTRVEQSELKKIVEVWTEVHRPVVDFYLANVASEEGFLAFHAVLDSCLAFAAKVQTTSAKIPNYVQSLLDKSVEPLAQLYSEEAFALAAGFFQKHVLKGVNAVRIHYLLHLQKILTISTAERRAAGIEKLVQQYSTALPERRFNGDAYTRTLFSFVQGSGFLPVYLATFKPIHYDNLFNVLLLENLLAAGALDLAEQYAKVQMAGNYREEYDLPYLQILQKIYRRKKDDEALAGVLEKLVPYTFDFDDYLFLYNRMPENDAKKKWRTRLLTRARNNASYGMTAASDFQFRLLQQEGSYKKMIEAINNYTPCQVILAYYQPMALTDKQALLKAILNKYHDSGWDMDGEQSQQDEDCFPELLARLEKDFGQDILKAVVKQAESTAYYHSSNRFVAFLKKQLGV